MKKSTVDIYMIVMQVPKTLPQGDTLHSIVGGKWWHGPLGGTVGSNHVVRHGSMILVCNVWPTQVAIISPSSPLMLTINHFSLLENGEAKCMDPQAGSKMGFPPVSVALGAVGNVQLRTFGRPQMYRTEH